MQFTPSGRQQPLPDGPPSQSVKASILAALSAEPGFEACEVRVSISQGAIVLEGFVSEAEQIETTMQLVKTVAGPFAIRSFLFVNR